MDSWQHKVTLTKQVDERTRLTVTAGLHKLGEQEPYFSVTGEEYDDEFLMACGCMHGMVLEHWPELAPVIALHLSAPNGEPLHFAANGLYWLGFGRYAELNLDTAARHFRISRDEAQALRERIMSGSGHDPDAYAAALDEMRPRMRREADEAVAILKRLGGE